MDPRGLRVIQNAYISLWAVTKEFLQVNFCNMDYTEHTETDGQKDAEIETVV